jgi:hypothetical protein
MKQRNNMEPTQTTTTATRKFGLNSISFLVGTLLFLLPFVEIRCNDQPLASNTGIGLALGPDYKTTSQMKSLDNPFGNKSDQTVTEKQKGEMYPSALIALILGIIGVIFSFLNPGPNKIALFIGGLAAICLIVLMVQIQMDVKDEPFSKSEESLGENLKITAEFTAWYYLSLISFIAAAFFSYRKRQIVIST